MNVSCPRCGIVIDCSGTYGELGCPRCGQVFLSPEQPPAAPPAPAFTVSAPSRSSYQPRRREATWFGGAFGATMGVIAAFVFINVLLCAGLLALGVIGSAVK